jgi:hypothetical protein
MNVNDSDVETRLFETINEIEKECHHHHYDKNNQKLEKEKRLDGDLSVSEKFSPSNSDLSDSESTRFSYPNQDNKIPRILITEPFSSNENVSKSVENIFDYNNNRLKPRKSLISRQSIEMFLNSFPTTDGEYVDREIFQTVNDIIKSNIGINKNMKLVDKIRLILKSHKFHFILIILVIFDIICVLIQVVIDIIHKDVHSDILHIFEEIAEIMSLCILSFFLFTIFANIVFLPKSFFKSKLEVFDALIVMISFSLEIVSIAKKDSLRAVELGLIVFR